MSLFSPTELKNWLGRTVATDRAELAERVVWGWLKPVLGLTERPAPVPDDVFSWAVELGGIAHENPAGLSSRQMGPYQEAFSAERRQEILDEAALSASTGAPTGSFPEPLEYPDGTW